MGSKSPGSSHDGRTDVLFCGPDFLSGPNGAVCSILDYSIPVCSILVLNRPQISVLALKRDVCHGNYSLQTHWRYICIMRVKCGLEQAVIALSSCGHFWWPIK
jgi:hypothetical protein